MHSPRSLFAFDSVLFEGREQKPPAERASDKLAGQTILNKYLQNNKGINWNGVTVDDFVIVACVFGFVFEACVDDSIVEVCVVHQSQIGRLF
ncbi:hypothetical protein TNCV_4956141 [Trichonephila clavipes]|nr:hypothetical protein TNCV_4956141 [Trichonephila clavipes]